jgi:hypothetical protein
LLKKIRLTTPEIAKKSSDEQFLQAPRNWEKCSALAADIFLGWRAVLAELVAFVWLQFHAARHPKNMSVAS